MKEMSKDKKDFPLKPSRLPDVDGKYSCYKCKVEKAVVSCREKACKSCFLQLVDSVFKSSLTSLLKNTEEGYLKGTEEDKYLLCISGGVNSMCLLHLTKKLNTMPTPQLTEAVADSVHGIKDETTSEIDETAQHFVEEEGCCKRKDASCCEDKPANSSMNEIKSNNQPLLLQQKEVEDGGVSQKPLKATNGYTDFHQIRNKSKLWKSHNSLLSSIHVVGVAYFNSNHLFDTLAVGSNLQENAIATDSLKEVVTKKFGYPFFEVPPGYSMHLLQKYTNFEPLTEGIPSLIERNGVCPEALFNESMEGFVYENLVATTLKEAIQGNSSVGKDFIEILCMRDLWALALLLGCNALLTGSCSDGLAETALSSLCNGGGINLSANAAYRDSRYPFCEVLRPLKSLSAKELVFYHTFHDLQSFPSTSSKIFDQLSRGLLSNIKGDTRRHASQVVQRSQSGLQETFHGFISQLASHFSATVSTINSTCDKIEAAQADGRCYLCMGWKDKLWRGLSDFFCNTPTTDMTNTEIEKSVELRNLLCVSCATLSNFPQGITFTHLMTYMLPSNVFDKNFDN